MRRIIEIKPLSNGAHRNQTWNDSKLPEGYAVIPDDMDTPNFPFGEIEVEGVEITDSVIDENGEKVEKVVGIEKVVTKWIPIEKPETVDEEEPVSETEQLRADIDYIAIMMGVEL